MASTPQAADEYLYLYVSTAVPRKVDRSHGATANECRSDNLNEGETVVGYAMVANLSSLKRGNADFVRHVRASVTMGALAYGRFHCLGFALRVGKDPADQGERPSAAYQMPAIMVDPPVYAGKGGGAAEAFLKDAYVLPTVGLYVDTLSSWKDNDPRTEDEPRGAHRATELLTPFAGVQLVGAPRDRRFPSSRQIRTSSGWPWWLSGTVGVALTNPWQPGQGQKDLWKFPGFLLGIGLLPPGLGDRLSIHVLGLLGRGESYVPGVLGSGTRERHVLWSAGLGIGTTFDVLSIFSKSYGDVAK